MHHGGRAILDRWGGALLAIGAPAAALLLRWALDPLLGDVGHYIPFYFAVALVAFLGGWQAGVAAVALSLAVGFAFFVYLPGRFDPHLVQDYLHAAVFLSIAALIVALAGWGRLSYRRAAAEAERYRRLLEQHERGEQQAGRIKERLELAAEATGYGTFDYFPQTGELIWSPQVRRHFGVSSDTPVTFDLFMRGLHPADRDRVNAMGHALLKPEGGGVFRTEYRTIGIDDGQERWLAVNGRVFFDEAGRPVRFIGATLDITNRKRAEEALRRSEARWNAAIESFAAGVIIATEDEQVIYWNPAARAMHGFTSEQEGIGPLVDMRSLFQLWTADGERMLPMDQWPIIRIRRGETVCRLELRLRRPDQGWEKFVSYSGTMVDTPGGERLIFLSVHDLTEQRRAEQAVRDNEAMLQKAIAAPTVGVLFFNLDGRIHRANEAFQRMSGYSAEELTRMPDWKNLTAPQDWDVTDRSARSLAEAGQTIPYEKQMIRKDGSRWWGLFAPTRLSGSGWQAECIEFIIDITERRRAEAALAAAHRSAERAKHAAEEANQAKDHFLAVLSHELRTPMTPVLATAAFLASDPQFPEAYREDVQLIRRNIEMEARLIDDLLDVTRIARGKVELHRQTARLCTILSAAIDVCRDDLEARKLELQIDWGQRPYWIEADSARLQQVFWNLLKNAIKFTPLGGRIAVRCRRCDGHVLAEIIDNGIGIEPDRLSHIFNAFEQAEQTMARQFGGLGLGLTISRSLVELHGGAIEAHSAGKGQGATFRVKLPLVEAAPIGAEPPEPAAIVPNPPAAVAARPLRILLVEDHPDTARIMKHLLQSDHHIVRTAGDLATALRLADGEQFDLLVSDLGLPDGSGLDLLPALRRRGLTFPAIALSGFGQEQDIRRSREAGFTRHLIKPIDPEQLRQAIAQVS